MHDEHATPAALPGSRILGTVTAERRWLLAQVDAVVGYVAARHGRSLAGWHLEAALVETRDGFRGGERVALRAWPERAHPGEVRHIAPAPQPFPVDVLHEIGFRVAECVDGVATIVPDLATRAPDVTGPAFGWDEEGFRYVGDAPPPEARWFGAAG